MHTGGLGRIVEQRHRRGPRRTITVVPRQPGARRPADPQDLVQPDTERLAQRHQRVQREATTTRFGLRDGSWCDIGELGELTLVEPACRPQAAKALAEASHHVLSMEHQSLVRAVDLGDGALDAQRSALGLLHA